MDYKISVIITNYNHHHFIYDAVQSVARQILQPYEVIVVDDGSDVLLDYGQICAMWKSINNPPNIVLINKPHVGIGSALNVGIRNMNGNIFTWLPADDLWKPEKLQRQNEFANLHPDKVLHAYCHKLQNGKSVLCTVNDLSNEQFANIIRTASPYYGTTFWIPKNILDTVGGFREDVPASEDYQWVLRSVIQHGIKYKLQPESLVIKRIHAGQTTCKYINEIPSLVAQFNKEIDGYTKSN